MNTKLVVAMSILTIFGLTSCEKDLYDPSQSKEDIKLTDVTVPADFNWQMSKDAAFSITSQANTVLSIYEDESCDKNSLLGTIPVRAGSNVKLPLSLSVNVKQVYVKYAEGVKAQAITVNENGEINFEVPAMPTTKSGAPDRIDNDFENANGILYYPNFGGGVVMFEDNFPEKGDYDFNDFVASYTAEVFTDESGRFIDKIEFRMQVRAIGATKVYIPHLRLSLPITSVEKVTSMKGEVENLNVKLVPDHKEKIVLAFYGAEDKGGKTFFNVEKDAASELPKKYTVIIEFKKNEAPIDFLYVDKFDFFLASKDYKQEIHMLGYGPAFTESEIDYSNTDYYKISNTNLVCGISVPKVIEHAYEKVDFLKAYPDFEKWIIGQKEYANKWYENGNSEYLFSMPY